MKLNHANLTTSDVAGLAGFFTDHFGFRLDAVRGKDAFALLTGSDGFALSLMRPAADDGPYPAGFHMGFFVESPEMVHAKRAELAATGFAPGEVQELTRGGIKTTTFYCNAPGGVLVEVASS